MNEKLKMIIDIANKYRIELSASLSALAFAFFMAYPVFASGEGTSGNITADMTSALSTAFQSVKADVISIITVALPPAIAIMAIGIALTVGIRFFSKFAKRS